MVYLNHWHYMQTNARQTVAKEGIETSGCYLKRSTVFFYRFESIQGSSVSWYKLIKLNLNTLITQRRKKSNIDWDVECSEYMCCAVMTTRFDCFSQNTRTKVHSCWVFLFVWLQLLHFTFLWFLLCRDPLDFFGSCVAIGVVYRVYKTYPRIHRGYIRRIITCS